MAAIPIDRESLNSRVQHFRLLKTKSASPSHIFPDFFPIFAVRFPPELTIIV